MDEKIKGKLTPLVRDNMECCSDPEPYIQVIEIPGNEVKFSGYCENCTDRFGGDAIFADVEITR